MNPHMRCQIRFGAAILLTNIAFEFRSVRGRRVTFDVGVKVGALLKTLAARWTQIRFGCIRMTVGHMYGECLLVLHELAANVAAEKIDEIKFKFVKKLPIECRLLSHQNFICVR